MYPNGQSFFNSKTKNKKPISAVACFFLQMQKASSKASFGLNKFYLRITKSLQTLTLLIFIFHFWKWNWKTKIEIIYFYGDLKLTDLLLNYWWIWAACWQYNKTHLSWNDQLKPASGLGYQFSMTPYQGLDGILLNVSSWLKYIKVRFSQNNEVAIWFPMRPYQLLGRTKSFIGKHQHCVSGLLKWNLLDITLKFSYII